MAETVEKVYIAPKVEFTERDIKSAEVLRTPTGPAVGITLRWSAARKMARLTDSHIGYRLAIIVDGRLVAAPRIKDKVGKRLIIFGRFSEADARYLADALSGRVSDHRKRRW